MDKFDGVIVFGPRASGKTHNAEALRRHYGLAHIEDGCDGRPEMLKRVLRNLPERTLVLTTADLTEVNVRGYRVVSFADAMREAGLPNHYRHGRKWLPADWMDEMPPQTGVTPEAFLRRHPDTGVLQLWPLDADTMDADSLTYLNRDLKDGDVVLFDWVEQHGMRTMTVWSDGSWTLDLPFPAGTNCFDDEDQNWGVTSLDEIAAEAYRSHEAFPIEVGVDGWTWSDGTAFRVRAFESGAAHFEEIGQDGPFQARVAPWMQACFGPAISADRVERNDRFIEEAIELVQACGGDRARVHALVDYVFDRPVGEPWQEVGGVTVTLAALCLANDIDMHVAAERELLRIWTKVDAIRAKQAAKPTGSALPISMPATADPVGFAIAALSDDTKDRLLGSSE